MTPQVDVDVLAGLQEILGAAAYTEEGLRTVLGPRPGVGLYADREVYLRRLGSDRPATLARLFDLGMSVSEPDAQAALRPLELSDLAASGLIELDSGSVWPLVRISPFDGMLFASDPGDARLRPDFVLGVNPSARSLASLTIRRHAGSTLDLGTGCGIQGLLASRHSGEVVGVDVNPRAVAFAELSAGLNGVRSFDARLGSWFEPVAGGRFDLVLANPPYVVSPDTTVLYRDSDLPGDEISRWILGQLADYLTEGGFAEMLCDWVHSGDGDWREPLEAALEGCGCDVVMIKYRTAEPTSYAGLWNILLAETDLPAFREALDRWLGYYRRAGIEAISWGLVALRRRSDGANWIRAIESPGGPSPGAGEHVERLFTGKDYLRGLSDDGALLDEVFVPIEGTRFERRSVWPSSSDSPDHTLVKLPRNLGFAARIETGAAEVVLRCDGTRRLRDVAAATARELGREEGELREASMAGVKRLLELGFLTPPAR